MLKGGLISSLTLAWTPGFREWVPVLSLISSDPIPISPQSSPNPVSSGQTHLRENQGIAVDQIGEYSRSTLQKNERPLYYTTLHWVIFVKAAMVYLLVGLFVGGLPIHPISGCVSVRSENVPLWFALLPAIWSVIWAAICFLPAFISYKTSEFTVTDKRLIVKTGFIRRQTHEVFISKLESISVDQGLLGRMFNAGTIITSGTGGSKQKFSNVANPLELRSAIQEIQAGSEK
jgi:membrane protein YdbS with pleckstrin-like domain